MNHRLVLAMAALAVLAAFPGESPARTWNVTVDGLGDAPTIQAGIDSAAAGDTVLVHPGTYNERIAFRGRDIVVRSSMGPQATVIDAGLVGGYVVSFRNRETRSAVLQGFTITGGRGSGNTEDITGGGGGILIINAQPSILDNWIIENEGGTHGGGIWCDGQPYFRVSPFYPLIQGNVISRNSAVYDGGGIVAWIRSAPTIIDNIISDNTVPEGNGGGIFVQLLPGDTSTKIIGNIIDGNYAADRGGGIFVMPVGGLSASWIIKCDFYGNIISNNTADGIHQPQNSGGGLWLMNVQGELQHNTIVGNSGNGPGGAVGVNVSGSLLIESNIIAFTESGGGVACDPSVTPTIRNNLVWQNVGGNGIGECAVSWDTDGNVVGDPAFCDAENGDYNVARNSPVLTHPAGPPGAYPVAGCGPSASYPVTWGFIKAHYPSGN